MKNDKSILDKLKKEWKKKLDEEPECLHLACPQCNGSGRKRDGTGMCIHYISCPCSRCTIKF